MGLFLRRVDRVEMPGSLHSRRKDGMNEAARAAINIPHIPARYSLKTIMRQA